MALWGVAIFATAAPGVGGVQRGPVLAACSTIAACVHASRAPAAGPPGRPRSVLLRRRGADRGRRAPLSADTRRRHLCRGRVTAQIDVLTSSVFSTTSSIVILAAPDGRPVAAGAVSPEPFPAPTSRLHLRLRAVGDPMNVAGEIP